MSDIVEMLRSTTAKMASQCRVPMDLWQDHSTAALQAADEVDRLRRDLAEAQGRAETYRQMALDWREASKEARSNALMEAAEIAEAMHPQLIVGELPCPSGDTLATALREKAAEGDGR